MEPLNWRAPLWGSVFVQPCGEMCGSSYAYVCSPSPLGVQFWRMLLYPVWIYFPTLGGEGTFVRVGVKTEFSASWLPPRMRTARMMGHREDPPSQRGRLLQQGKRKELPMWLLDWLDGGQARNEPKLCWSHRNSVHGSGFKSRQFELCVVAWKCQAKLYTTPKTLDCKVLPSLVTAANLDKQSLLANCQLGKTIGSVAHIPQELKDYFWTHLLTSRGCWYACEQSTAAPCRNIW